MGTATRLLVFVIATAAVVGSPIARAAEECSCPRRLAEAAPPVRYA
jgi:hypothetical protein